MIKKKKAPLDWVWEASRKESEWIVTRNVSGPRLAVLDLGAKENILRELVPYFSEIKVFPSRVSVKEVEEFQPRALMLTNGPGDPACVEVVPDSIRHFLGKIPVFGICMGHQVLALALGAKTYRLKFGHRGSNHPIQDKLLKQIYISAQNHGFAVEASTLPSHCEVTHINLNDNTVAGFYSQSMKCLGIQYHPESCPGPHDSKSLFKFFAEQMV